MLPAKESQTKIVDDLFLYDENGNKRKGDKFETDLVQMLEQKHGKNFRLFDLESCIPTISLEKLCELCKHIEAWLSGGQHKIVVLQDRLVSATTIMHDDTADLFIYFDFIILTFSLLHSCSIYFI